MRTLAEAFERDACYWGERGHWLIACGTNRDADCLARSNWRCFIRELTGQSFAAPSAAGSTDISPQVAIEEASHWACGWVQYLIIDPAAIELVEKAEEIRVGLEDYPVIDEDDFSELERGEYYEYASREIKGVLARALKDFELTPEEEATLDDATAAQLIEWFESKIPSGEYQRDGYPNFDLVFDDLDLESLLTFLRTLPEDPSQMQLGPLNA